MHPTALDRLEALVALVESGDATLPNLDEPIPLAVVEGARAHVEAVGCVGIHCFHKKEPDREKPLDH
jgi:hypothetical protein